MRLCDRCVYRRYVEIEGDMLSLERCGYFSMPLSRLGSVKKCSGFVAKTNPYVEGYLAWRFKKLDDGTVTFIEPKNNDCDGDDD